MEAYEDSDTEIEDECAAQLEIGESYKSNSDLKKVTKNAHLNEDAVKDLEQVRKN